MRSMDPPCLATASSSLSLEIITAGRLYTVPSFTPWGDVCARTPAPAHNSAAAEIGISTRFANFCVIGFLDLGYSIVNADQPEHKRPNPWSRLLAGNGGALPAACSPPIARTRGRWPVPFGVAPIPPISDEH